MKVLHINSYQQGGAALCAIRICQALSNEGIESRMLFAEGSSLPEGIVGAIATSDDIFWNRNLFLRAIKKFFKILGIWLVDVEKTYYRLKKANTSNQFVHQPLSSYKNIAQHPLIEWADIIHLHWVANFVDYPTFFKAVNKPIVWTLHDKYPAVGVMHYCSSFFPIPDKLKSIDAYCRKIKRESVCNAKQLNIVAISELMLDVCNNSDVLGGFPVTIIHNGVDTTLFHPLNKEKAKKQVGLSSNTIVFLFSSLYMFDMNKGLDRAIAALEKVNIQNKILVCLGGKYENIKLSCNFPIIFTGVIKEPATLSIYYSAADFFLQCSYEETFAQTPLEAMACGTPVITTPCSGAKDIIRPFNGIICYNYNPDALAEGIKEALCKQYRPTEIRKFVIDNFNYCIIARKYIKLYETIKQQDLDNEIFNHNNQL